jgi:hypothetical protein
MVLTVFCLPTVYFLQLVLRGILIFVEFHISFGDFYVDIKSLYQFRAFLNCSST